MAAPMDHHRRKKVCDVRPAYRDGRREKAVKMSSDLEQLMEQVDLPIAEEVIIWDSEMAATNLEVPAASSYKEPAPTACTVEIEQEDHHDVADVEQGSEIQELDLSENKKQRRHHLGKFPILYLTEKRKRTDCFFKRKSGLLKKVYTINQESRYLLIQGVPDIKVTDELLKLFSLYGTIEEYRILEDYPTEVFTKVYWIKYADLQAARVAKRKMDDRSFYGGTLHVCYAPEFESVEDTRRKLQERRKDVAHRLRRLQQETDEVLDSSGHDKPSSSAAQDIDPLTYGARTLNDQDSQKTQLTGPRKPDPTICKPVGASLDSQQSPNEFSELSVSVHSEDIPPQLPAPPRPLPVSEWKSPVTSRDQFPRLPTAHATLPLNYNPYPDDYEPDSGRNQQDQDSHRSRFSIEPPATQSNTVTNTDGDPVTNRGAFDCKAEARPKFKLRHDRRSGHEKNVGTNQRPRIKFLERVAWRDRDKCKEESGSDEMRTKHETSDDHRARVPTLKRPHPSQVPNPSSQISSVHNHASSSLQTSSLVPRQLLGKRKYPGTSTQGELSGLGISQENRVGQSQGEYEGSKAGTSGLEAPPVTGSTSFDQTVQSIRQRMRNVAQVPGNLSDVGRQAQPPQQQARAGPAAVQPAAAAAADDGASRTKRMKI